MAFCSAPRGTGSRLMICLERWKMTEDRITIEERDENASFLFEKLLSICKEENTCIRNYIYTKRNDLFLVRRRRCHANDTPQLFLLVNFGSYLFFFFFWLKLYHRTDNRSICSKKKREGTIYRRYGHRSVVCAIYRSIINDQGDRKRLNNLPYIYAPASALNSSISRWLIYIYLTTLFHAVDITTCFHSAKKRVAQREIINTE